MLPGFGNVHADQNGFGPHGIFPGLTSNLNSRNLQVQKLDVT